jgi:hypothetical protein
MVGLPLRDSLPSGVVSAASKTPSLLLIFPDGSPHIPNDPVLPPNPIFPSAVSLPVIDQIFNGLGGIDSDGLLGISPTDSNWLTG